mmetsp:Transcript_68751/g.118012  ORF Transcript_68751/g.118012 Transcript_68751/m.118012 type:complete len:187 (+) Transcript_68751:1-561(+)
MVLIERARGLVRVQNDLGQTAMHLAASAGHHTTLRIVHESGADISHQDMNGWTPLHHAAWKGEKRSVATLLELGADRTVVGRKGRTPKVLAEEQGHPSVARILSGDFTGEQPTSPPSTPPTPDAVENKAAAATAPGTNFWPFGNMPIFSGKGALSPEATSTSLPHPSMIPPRSSLGGGESPIPVKC